MADPGNPDVTAARGAPAVYIVTITVPVAAFERRLAGIGGARMIRTLGDDRAVVLLGSPADSARLVRLDGVAAVVADRLERPDAAPGGPA